MKSIMKLKNIKAIYVNKNKNSDSLPLHAMADIQINISNVLNNRWHDSLLPWLFYHKTEATETPNRDKRREVANSKNFALVLPNIFT